MYENLGGRGPLLPLLTPMRVSLKCINFRSVGGCVATLQWRSKGEQVARPGAQALGAHQHAFCSHLNTRFEQKFRPKYT